MKLRSIAWCLPLALAACDAAPPAALGTLERDRITLPAPASERIVRVAVREGERVARGAVLLELAPERARARLDAADAELDRLRQVLAETRSGPRAERVEEARQRVARARSVAVNAGRERERVEAVVARGVLPPAERDRARSAAAAATADLRAASAQLAELEHGARAETLAQAEAAVRAAEAQRAALALDLERIRITAPRDGTVDSLPYKEGDQPPAGATLATLLVGERVHARVHVPQPLRLAITLGSPATVHVSSGAGPFAGRVRSLRGEASFTPYYALSGEDSAHLSYLAEIELEPDADALPLGLPVRVEFPSGGK